MSNELSIKDGMTELGVTTYDGEKAIVSSRKVADVFTKRHRNVLRDIDNLIDKASDKFTKLNFIKSKYKDKSGKKNRMYLITPSGLKCLVDNYRPSNLTKESLEWAKGFYNKNLKVVRSKKEKDFEATLKTIFNNEDIITQLPVLKYRVDFWLPFANTIVEYDEKHHQYQTEEDKERIERIEQELMRKIIKGEKIYPGGHYKPNPWLKNKNIISTIRVKEGKEDEGLRKILCVIQEDTGNSPTMYMSY